jgi:ATP-dependent exoDNAse (exonuclease V) beta subunit
MSDEGSDSTISTPFRYHLELTPAQLKIVHTALRSLLDDFGHDQSEIQKLIHELLAKLPDEHAIRAIQLDVELEREGVDLPRPSDDGPPPSAA